MRASKPKHKAIPPNAWPVYYSALATLFEAGLPITDSFVLLSEQTESPELAALSERLARRVAQGNSISVAMAEDASLISVFHREMIAMGEENGELDTVLNFLADFEEKKYATAQKLKAATAYPAMLTTAALLSLLLAPHYFEPTISDTLASVGESVPLAAQIVFNISSTMNSPWVWLSLIVGYLLMRRKLTGFFQRISVKKVLWSIGYKIPGLSKALKATSQERFARALALQLESGQKLDKAIRRAARVTGNPFYLDGFLDAIRAVQDGVDLAEALDGTGLFDKTFISMVDVGTNSGQVTALLKKSADMLTLNLEADLRSAMAAIEPVVLLLAGGVVGAFVLTMMGPMAKLVQNL